MKFEEIFDHDGIYASDDFADGFCFRIKNGSLYGVQYKNAKDFFPDVSNFQTYKGLFSTKYFEVFTIQSLFKKNTSA